MSRTELFDAGVTRAAVKACGAGAVLSGRAAAHLHGLVKGRPPPPEVSTATERRIEGILTRRSRTFDPRDVSESHAIPVTTVARTLVDLAAVLPVDALARACHEAGVLHGTTPSYVDAVLDRQPQSRGAAALRRVLHGDVHVTLSTLEGRSRHAWEQDRRREREARARGDEFRRYSYGDVFEDSRFMLAELRGLLGA